MGFWSDTRRFLSATGSALSQGAAVLAEHAIELEKSAHRLGLESSIRSLERQRKEMGELWFSPSNAAKSEELLSAYQKLIKEYPTESGIQTKIQLAKLESDRRALAVKKQVQSIVALNDLIKTTQYQLPIDEIVARERLKRLLNELLAIAREHEHRHLLQRARTRIQELDSEVAQLQLQRRTTESFQYESGKLKEKVSRYDGKLDGIYQQWYENGNQKWQLRFSAGDLRGHGTNWCEDGSLFMTADFARGTRKFQLFLPDKQPLLSLTIRGRNCSVVIDAEPLKGFSLVMSERPTFFRKLILTVSEPRLLLFFWRARKPGLESILVGHLPVAMNRFECAVDELRSIKESG